MEHELTAVGVRVAGRSGPVLDDVSVTASAGRMLAVTGSSGAGKTTLLSVLGGLAPSAPAPASPGRAPRWCCRPTAWCRP